MNLPQDLKYTSAHEWLRIADDEVVVGITEHAQDQLGDVVFVELPAVGTQLQRGASFGVVESVKAVSDLYAPIAGEVLAVNEALPKAPELVNQDPYGQAWMLRLRPSAPVELDALLNADAYAKLLR